MAKRVFFSFHYKDVAEFRANVVRNHRVVKKGEAEYFDASLWEETKKKGDLPIKKMINDGIDRTTVTTVLIGSETYARRWVRYEIMKSLQKGNLLLGIHINNVANKDQTTKAAGPNPFEYLGYRFSQDGKQIELYEWDGSKWVIYCDLEAWKFDEPRSENARGKFFRLDSRAKVYDWVNDHGYDKFDTWIGE